MLGIIIEADASTSADSSRLFYKFGTQTTLERVMRTCTMCDYAHKVLLSMPANDKGLINGTVFQSKMIGGKAIEYMGRPIENSFYGRPEDKTARLYRAALTNGLTTVVKVNALDVLMQAWFISTCIESFYRHGGNSFVYASIPEYDPGFSVEIFPFFMLADANIKNDEMLDVSDYIKPRFSSISIKNADGLLIPKISRTMRFEEQSQAPELGRILEELDMGADISSLLGDLSE